MGDEAPGPEHEAHLSGAAVGLVLDWLTRAFDEDDLQAAWPLTDEPLRLALVQSWVMLESERTDIADEDRDELAAELAAERPSHPLWPEFAEWRLARWHSVFPGWVRSSGRRGVVSSPSLLGVSLEAVMIAETDGTARPFDAGQPVVVQRFLVRHLSIGVRLAGIGGVLPIPGWPPSETDRLDL